jgi:transcription antitermination protein NusB
MTKGNKKHKPNPRRKAREYCVQALYQWQVSGDPINDIVMQFLGEHVVNGTDTAYFQQLVEGVVADTESLDAHIKPLCRQDFKDMNPVELAIMRSAVFELIHRPDVPFKVVLNEAIDLAKNFGAQDGYRFINGVLHQLAPRLREAEVASKDK